MWPVDKRVGNVKNQDAGLAERYRETTSSAKSEHQQPERGNQHNRCAKQQEALDSAYLREECSITAPHQERILDRFNPDVLRCVVLGGEFFQVILRSRVQQLLFSWWRYSRMKVYEVNLLRCVAFDGIVRHKEQNQRCA